MTTSFIVIAGDGVDDGSVGSDPPHATWSSAPRCQIHAWADRGWVPDNLVASESGAVAWGGQAIAAGRPPIPEHIAAGLVEASKVVGSGRWDALRGTFGAVAVDADGRGRAFCDVLGLRPIYWVSDRRRLIAGTDVHRVARAAFGSRARPDVDCVAAIASVGYRLPGRSGYEHVRLLEPGETIVLTGGGNWHIEGAAGPPWLDLGDLEGASTGELMDVISSEIRAGLDSMLQVPDPTVEITGGKDSRLVLAMLLQMGVARSHRFETAGLPDLPDVQVASEIAGLLGLDHHRIFETANVEGLPFDVIFDRFVVHTAGMVSGWDARPIRPLTDKVRISGLNGEALRAHRRLPPGFQQEAAGSALEQFLPPSALGLARPAFQREVSESFRCCMQESLDAASNPHDALDTFLLKVQTRQQYGPLDEIQRFHRFVPLTSARAIRAAFALGGPERHAELIHYLLIKRASTELVGLRFAGDRWPSDLARFVAVDEPVLHDRTQIPRPPSPSGPAKPLMATLHQSLADDRRATLLAQFEDASNPVWELLDRERALRSVDGYGELRGKQRKELYGAASAARWSSR